MKRLYEFLINSKTTELISYTDFVNLGLSVLWAKCNIGAKEETDYGHYYQWGGLEPMNNKECNWENSPFNDGKYYFDEEYFKSKKYKVAPNGILAKEYDIAYKTYGDNYHIPTKDNIEELINCTNKKWITNYNDTGINGITLINKSDSTKFIFIPAAGYKWGADIQFYKTNFALWTSSNDNSCEFKAWSLEADNNDNIDKYTNNLFVGFSIRAVKEK